MTCCRLLASLERQIVMNLLWLESAITVATMAAWVVCEHKKFISLVQSQQFFLFLSLDRLYNNALANLSRLHILPNASAKLALNSTFKANLRQAITGG